MRAFAIFASFAALFAGTLGTMNAAQPGASARPVFDGGGAGAAPQWQGSGLPYGDYQQTCRNIRNDGHRLDATCQKRDGSWRNTSLNYRYCQGSIVNDDGRLRCSGGGGYGDRWRGGVPPGTYQQTCRNIRIDGNRLTATCQKRNGEWRDTSLKNFSYCRIENDNGHLRCQ
jgi:hypothetical protein